jgi:hypothetical protein
MRRAENFMMRRLVANVDHWHKHIEAQGIRERFGAKIGAARGSTLGDA